MTQTITIPQDKETPLTTHKTPFGSVLALYNRSNDSVEAGTIGQDYAAFRFSKTDLAFAVCDGVGQSFMGDLAARVLGDGLIDWLWSLDAKPEGAATFATQVEAALAKLTEKGTQIVAEYTLPATLPAIVKQALEMQRAYGSESMFVAGRIALEKDFIVVAWLGDSPVAAIDFNGELVDLGPHGSTAERWNATTGIKGHVHTWVGTADQVARVAGYTDGLGVATVPTDDDLAKMVEHWKDNPPSDDASLIDIRLATSPETIGSDDPDKIERVNAIEVSGPIPPQPEKSPVRGAREIKPDEGTKDPVKPEAPRGILPKGMKVEKHAITNKPAKPDHTPSADTTLDEIRAWQQAAREKLIGAKLALDQIERLLGDKDKS